MQRLQPWTVSLALVLPALAGCKTEDPQTTESPGTTDNGTTADPGTTTDDGTTTIDEPTAGPTSDPTSSSTTIEPATETAPATETSPGETGVVCPDLPLQGDESRCEPLASDYQPRVNNSQDDTWPECVADMGPYPLVDKSPSTIARIVAYENIADLLWRKQNPTPEDFTKARDEYVIPEGLESRVVRREDLHYDPIPMADWDPQVDADKQCTVAANVEKYPDRCVGPSKMQPLLDQAFAAGQTGEGDPNVHAARIHAGLLWFLYLSIYKEANTCATVAPKDCDSAWAYYTGGEAIEGGIGMAAELQPLSLNTHERIHDGIMAVRCWRDTAQENMMYPLLDAVDADSKALFEQGWEQLDQATHRGFALLVRDHLRQYLDALCAGTDPAAHWAFVAAAGPVLDREAAARDATLAATLADLWAGDGATAEQAIVGLDALDALFPCP